MIIIIQIDVQQPSCINMCFLLPFPVFVPFHSIPSMLLVRALDFCSFNDATRGIFNDFIGCWYVFSVLYKSTTTFTLYTFVYKMRESWCIDLSLVLNAVHWLNFYVIIDISSCFCQFISYFRFAMPIFPSVLACDSFWHANYNLKLANCF